MLSDEEKKAIEWLKKADWFSARLYAPTILNLIEKQSKEIEELMNEVMEKELIIDGMREDRRIVVEEIQKQYFISKEKIKERIKEYYEYDKRMQNKPDWHTTKYYEAKALEKLLEE